MHEFLKSQHAMCILIVLILLVLLIYVYTPTDDMSMYTGDTCECLKNREKLTYDQLTKLNKEHLTTGQLAAKKRLESYPSQERIQYANKKNEYYGPMYNKPVSKSMNSKRNEYFQNEFMPATNSALFSSSAEAAQSPFFGAL